MTLPSAIGADIGATKTLLVRTDSKGRIADRERFESRREEGPEAVIERTARAAEKLMRRASEIEVIGAGFAGLVDAARGRVTSSIMLPGFDDFPLAERLRERLGIPAYAMNDAKAAGIGEYAALGSPKGMNLVVMTIGTGIGGALILDGKLYLGSGGFAGEIGNTTIDHVGGPVCWCGAVGCLNMLASGSALTEAARRVAALSPDSALHAEPGPLTLERIAAIAKEGDAAAQEVIRSGAAALGAGIANVMNLLNPERVSLMGGVIALGEGYLDLVRAEVRRRVFGEIARGATIAACRMGQDTGAFGAAIAAAERLAAENPGAVRTPREDLAGDGR